MTKRRLALLVGFFIVALGLGELPAGAHHKPKHPSAAGTTTTTLATTTTTTTAPSNPTTTVPPADVAAICGNRSVLDGPTSAPAGAVVVQPGQNLNDATQAYPAGTTFYLTAGTHTLGDSVFDQVVAKSGNTYVGAPGAVLDGRGVNRTAISGVAPHNATNVTIKHLTVTGFVALQDQGVTNPSANAGWRFERNTFSDNQGGAIFLGTDSVIAQNCLDSNGQYGISSYKPITNVVVDGNEISRNNTGDWEYNADGSLTYCGCSGAMKFWDVNGAQVTNNWIHHNYGTAVWADTNNIDFLIAGNIIEDNDAQAIFYEISYNARIVDNVIRRNTHRTGRTFEARGDSFPIGTIYIAESGGDARVAGSSTLEIARNTLENNWGGVVLWEAADRFCGSAANTSAGYCTVVNPDVTIEVCQSDAINNEPYYSDCRWKTQNVLVANNTLTLDKAAIACTSTYCGRTGLLSNYGVTAPYLGDVVAKRITFASNNVFRDNTYTGDWRFVPHDQGRLVDFATWQADPYLQDAGSTLNGAGTTTTTTSSTSSTTSTTTTSSTTTTTAPAPTGNVLDYDTATLTNGVGKWQPWFNTAVQQAEVYGEPMLRVEVTGPYGWGVTLANWPGFATGAGDKTAKLTFAAPSGTTATMTVHWKDSAGTDIATETLVATSVDGYVHATAAMTAPIGTATVYLDLTGQGANGDIFWFDNFSIEGR